MERRRVIAASRRAREGVFMPTYVLPDLEYDYGALEPHISGQIMQLHHDKHHATYVSKANQFLEKLAEARDTGDLTHLAALEKGLAFNVSGHVLHSIFWRNLTPKGGDRPKGALADAVNQHFGGFEKMKRVLVETAGSLMGSGWAALAWEPLGRRLVVWQIHDHQNDVTQAGIPLLLIDGWEHAYYLQYHTDKARFFEAIWNLWNWDDVLRRFEAARALQLELPLPAMTSA
jgi:Fe-Mn family superoxide dismutase